MYLFSKYYIYSDKNILVLYTIYWFIQNILVSQQDISKNIQMHNFEKVMKNGKSNEKSKKWKKVENLEKSWIIEKWKSGGLI